jgi:very-short-patch-repair endonuclease
MSNYFNCKYCNLSFYHRVFKNHIEKIHNESYNNYIKNNINDFSKTGYKICIECKNVHRGRSEKCGNCFTKTHDIKQNQNIECKVCNKQIHSKLISLHLKKEHKVKLKEYIKTNLNDFELFGWCKCCMCENVTKKQGNKHEPTCSVNCLSKLRKKIYNGRIGKPHTEETKKRLSFLKTGTSIPSIRGDLHPSKRKEVRDKISKTRIVRGVAKGEKNPMYGKTHTPEAIEKIFSHRKMNKLEKIVANLLDREKIPYKFQFFINKNGICKSYDFKLLNNNIILEIDGDFWHGNPNTKNHYIKSNEININDTLKEKIATENGYKILRFWESDIKNNPEIILKGILIK